MIKQLTMAAFVSAQIGLAAQPAAAAEFARNEEQRMGAFGGLSVRVPLDGDRRERQVRAGLALAPTLETRSLDGRSTARIGEGLELGYRAGQPTLSLAGQELSSRPLGMQDDGDDDDGVSSAETIVLIGIGVIVLAAAAGTIWLATELDDSSD